MTQTPTDALRLVPDDHEVIKRCVERMPPLYMRGKTEGPYLHSDIAGLIDIIGRLAAAPASPLQGGGWQDISTAPKDGAVVDLFYPERGRLTDATWGPTGWGRHEWRGSHTVKMIPSEKPTHWMPLPAAPTGEPK